MNRYNRDSITYFSTNEGLSHNDVRSMLEDRNGNIWFGTWRNGLCRYDPDEDGTGGSFIYYTTEEGIYHTNVVCMLEDSRGRIWFGADCRWSQLSVRHSIEQYNHGHCNPGHYQYRPGISYRGSG